MKNLKDQARDYLDSQKGNLPSIAEQTGIKVQWLYKFMGKHSMKDPGVTKINKILCHRDGTLLTTFPNENT